MTLRIKPSGQYQGHPSRTESRARLAIEATLETVHGKSSGYLINVSYHGAMVQTQTVPGRDAFVVLRCGPLDALGTVAWIDRGYFGIKFDEPISENLVIELRRIADSVASARPCESHGRPGLAARSLTAQEWELAENWAVSNLWR